MEEENIKEIQKINSIHSESHCKTNELQKEFFFNDLDEKFKQALKNEPQNIDQSKQPSCKIDIPESITIKSTEANITGENKEHLEECEDLISSKVCQMASKVVNPKNPKIFKIKKYLKYNKFLEEICSEEELSENEKKIYTEPQCKKISPFSKVNFSKLNSEEKDNRLKNLARLVKRLRRKVRSLENKVKFNSTKILNRHIWNKVGISTKNKNEQQEFNFDFDKIVNCLKKTRNSNDIEYDDQKHLIENIISFISEDKLKVDSFLYKKLCSIVRLLIPKDRIKFISKSDSKITVSFPETEVYITNTEFLKLAKFKENEDIMRAALGVYDTINEKVIKITKEEPRKDENKKFFGAYHNSNSNCFDIFGNNYETVLNNYEKNYDKNDSPYANYNLTQSRNKNSNFLNSNIRENEITSMNMNSQSFRNFLNNLSDPITNSQNVNNFNYVNNKVPNDSSFQMNPNNVNNNLNFLNLTNDPLNQLRTWLYNQTYNSQNLQQMLLQNYSNIAQNNSNNFENKLTSSLDKNVNQLFDLGNMNPNNLKNIPDCNLNANSMKIQNSCEKNFILK